MDLPQQNPLQIRYLGTGCLETVDLMPATNNEDRLTQVERDTSHIQALFDRLDASVEKLTAISADVTRLLAVHENRLTSQERLQAQLETKMDKRQELTDDRFGKIYDKIDEVKQDLVKEIEQNTDKISNLQQWMWTAIGGVSVLYFLIDKIPLHL